MNSVIYSCINLSIAQFGIPNSSSDNGAVVEAFSPMSSAIDNFHLKITTQGSDSKGRRKDRQRNQRNC